MVDKVNKISKTALMYACMEDHEGVVKELLDHGADPLQKDILHNEWNSLHFAIMQNNVNTVKLILENAKKCGNYEDVVGVKDAVGRLPLVVAEDHFKDKVADYLKTL